ncbi:hypothetical protein [Solibacillus daqui]|uniref:hypothetical protein n=1 Tax=Solibacillus daqui TaxID=2912187 RepID=UPI002366EBAF|nr:hypothetical protein [Solibacillus daqui]
MKEILFFIRNEINTTYQSFIYETPVKDLLISNYEWPSPIDNKNDYPIVTFVTDPLIMEFLLNKILVTVKEKHTITLGKQEVYKRSKSIFKSIAPFNEALNYLDTLNYLRIGNGGKSGRKKIIVLNPKLLGL